MAGERFSIAQVTPYPWEWGHEVNGFVDRLAEQLRGRGHRVAVVAPSSSRELVRASRARIARLREEPDALWEEEPQGGLLGVGQAVAPSGRRGATVALPVDVSRTVEDFLETAELDFVHVHEPFAPSAASMALRHSRALNVGTFHSATERTLSTQVARRVVDLLFGRLDARTASFAATGELLGRHFPGDYRVIRPGADAVARPEAGGDEVELLYVATEERSALRTFLRAVRRLPEAAPWRATVLFPSGPPDLAGSMSRALRERVSVVGPGDEAERLATAEIAVMASSGSAPVPGLPLRAMAAGAVPVASRLPQYEEALDEGRRGPLFEPRDVETLAAHLTRLIDDREARAAYVREAHAIRRELDWSRVADEFEALYAGLAGRRHAPSNATVRRRLRSRPTIQVDLHMHTDHSPDCATPVDVLIETAKARGLDAIAVTDHNEVSGALEARERADGLKIIVAEEVKTASQGEVIGLFIEEKIPRGMTLEETLAEIHRQGGLAYVPHPFDRMHSVPDYEHLLGVVGDIDAIEVFNPRVAFSAFNDEAERFAAKYRIAAGAGSDSHVAQGLGSVKIAMRDFDGPEEFLASLRDADIVRRRQSLLYVQALKFIQTRGRTGDAGARAAGSNS